MVRQLLMNPLWIQPPAWLAIDPKAAEEPTQSADESIYHRPVLQKEAVELLKPKTGVLILDGTCGGGGQEIRPLLQAFNLEGGGFGVHRNLQKVST